VQILTAVSNEFTTLVKDKLGRGTGAARITATIFDEPHALPKAISPKVTRTLAVAVVLGLGLGLLCAFLRSGVDSRIRTKRNAEDWFGAPVLGALPKGSRGRHPLARRNGTLSRAEARTRDAIQMLRANLQFSGTLTGTTFVVTSAVPDEGKSTVTANLGVALAQAGRDVIIVEADLRRPMMMRYLDMPEKAPGLAEVLEGTVRLGDALRSIPVDAMTRDRSLPSSGSGGRLRALSSGATRTNPGDLTSSDSLPDLIKRLKADAEYVLFDAPPLLLVGDAFSLVRECDGVLLVARAGRTTREAAESVRSALDGLGAQSIGVVITEWMSNQDDYGYAGAYSYGSTAAPPDVVAPKRGGPTKSTRSTTR
jgi:receptor protein-tyrosine kinase